MQRVETIRSMARSARRIILMAESEKFSRTGTTDYFSPEEISMIITDNGIPESAEAFLRRFPLELKIIDRPGV